VSVSVASKVSFVFFFHVIPDENPKGPFPSKFQSFFSLGKNLKLYSPAASTVPKKFGSL